MAANLTQSSSSQVNSGSNIQPVYIKNGKALPVKNTIDGAGETLGLVKTGGDVSITNGIITVDALSDKQENLEWVTKDDIDAMLSGTYQVG